MGKGEIARYEQFLLFLQCFQKVCFPGASKGVIVWEWVNKRPQNLEPVEKSAYKVPEPIFEMAHVLMTVNNCTKFC